MLIIWSGPVQASTLELAKWSVSPPPRVVTVNQGQNGKISSSAFQALAADYSKSGGTPLRGLLAAKGIAADIDEPILLTGFSAAHGLIEAILATPEDAARVTAVGAFDAYFTNSGMAPKPGYLAYMKGAAAGHGRMLMTSSHVDGPTYPSGAEATRMLVAASNIRTTYDDAPDFSVPPAQCEAASHAGRFQWLVYKDRTGNPVPGSNLKASHVQHATVLAPHFVPLLAAGASLEGTASTPSSSSGAAAAVPLLALGLWVASEVWKAA